MWQIPKNMGIREGPWSTSPLHGKVRLHASRRRRPCWPKQQKVQSGGRSPPPLFFSSNASSVDANVVDFTISNTHQPKAISFSCDAPASGTLTLKRAPVHYFRRPCHHLTVALPWFLSALQFSIVVSCMQLARTSACGRARAGGSLVDFQSNFCSLFVFSEKATSAGDDKQRK